MQGDARIQREAAKVAEKAALQDKASTAIRAVPGLSTGTDSLPAWCEIHMGYRSVEFILPNLALPATFWTVHGDKSTSKVCDLLARRLGPRVIDGLSTAHQPELRVDPKFDDIGDFLHSHRDTLFREANGLGLRLLLPYQMFVDLPSDQLAGLINRAKAILDAPIES
jgi:hypothetical protein